MFEIVEGQHRSERAVAMPWDGIEYVVAPRKTGVFSRCAGNADHVKLSATQGPDRVNRAGTINQKGAARRIPHGAEEHISNRDEECQQESLPENRGYLCRILVRKTA